MLSLWFTMLCYRFNSLSHGVGLVRLWLTCLFLWLRLASFPGSDHTPRRIPTGRSARQFVAHTPAHRLQFNGQFVAHTPAHRLQFNGQFGAHTPAQTQTSERSSATIIVYVIDHMATRLLTTVWLPVAGCVSTLLLRMLHILLYL